MHSGQHDSQADILVVDDTPASLRMLAEQLTKSGYNVRPAPSGKLALQAAGAAPPDLVLLDVRMPDMNGYEVCKRLKADPATRDAPVIFISAMDEVTDKLRGFEVGGVDYVTKPVQLPEVLARVRTHLTIQRLQVQLREARQVAEQAAAALAQEKQKSEQLLYNMIPKPVAEVLREGKTYPGTAFADVTVLHCSVVGFAEWIARHPPEKVLEILNRIATPFDRLCQRFGLHKLEAGEGCYVVAGGVPRPTADQTDAVAAMALDICAAATTIHLDHQTPLELKLGIHSAPVVGGVVGLQAPRFTLFGEALEVAALLAQTSVPGHIQVSDATRQRLTPAAFTLRTRAAVSLAGHGRIQTHFLSART